METTTTPADSGPPKREREADPDEVARFYSTSLSHVLTYLCRLEKHNPIGGGDRPTEDVNPFERITANMANLNCMHNPIIQPPVYSPHCL